MQFRINKLKKKKTSQTSSFAIVADPCSIAGRTVMLSCGHDGGRRSSSPVVVRSWCQHTQRSRLPPGGKWAAGYFGALNSSAALRSFPHIVEAQAVTCNGATSSPTHNARYYQQRQENAVIVPLRSTTENTVFLKVNWTLKILYRKCSFTQGDQTSALLFLSF